MIRTLLTVIALSIFASTAFAQPAGERPRIGVVLGGGGARGAAHIGVLKVLEEERIPIDVLVGTSMGAVVGGLYASGYTAEELAEFITNVDWGATLQDSPERVVRPMRRKSEDFDLSVRFSVGLSTGGIKLPPGMMYGQHLDVMFRRMTSHVRDVRSFDDLGIPFRAVATDLATGETVVMGDGDLVWAMRASMSVPGAFAPVRREGRTLIDGGVVDNVPVDIARSLGADIVIAVDVGADLPVLDEGATALSVSLAATGIMLRNRVREVLETMGPDDTLLRVELGDISGTQFGRADEAIPLGESTARDSAAGFQRLALGEAEYDAWTLRRTARADVDMTIVEVAVDATGSPNSEQLVRSRIRQPIGAPFDLELLEADLDRLYGVGRFATIDYELQTAPGGTRIVIRPLDKPWGPTFLRFGLRLNDDFEGGGTYGITLQTLTYTNSRRGREYRTRIQVGDPNSLRAEVYQPLDFRDRWFARVRARAAQEEFVARVEGARAGAVLISDVSLNAALGRNFGETWTLAAGADVGHAWLKGRSGFALVIPADDIPLGRAFATLTRDTLDDFALPRRGHRLEVALLAPSKVLGADEDNTRLEWSFDQALSFGRRRFLLGLSGANVTDPTSGYREATLLGGLFRLSGYYIDELVGEDFLLARLMYFDTMGGGARSVFGAPLILGASVEYGDTWLDQEPWRLDQLRWGGSVFAGIDTALGSLYLAYGRAEQGRQAVYFTFGTLFDIGRSATFGSS